MQLAYSHWWLLNLFLFVSIPSVLEQSLKANLKKQARQIFDLRPAGIIQMLDLKRPIYRQTAAYGTWDGRISTFHGNVWTRVEALKEAVK